MRRGQALFFFFLFNLWTNCITLVLCSCTCVVGFLSRWFLFSKLACGAVRSSNLSLSAPSCALWGDNHSFNTVREAIRGRGEGHCSFSFLMT